MFLKRKLITGLKQNSLLQGLTKYPRLKKQIIFNFTDLNFRKQGRFYENKIQNDPTFNPNWQFFICKK